MRCYIFVISGLLLLSNLFASPLQEGQDLDFLDDYDARFSISSVWQKIKEGLQKAWQHIKDAAKQTVEMLQEWIYNLKIKTDEILEKVKERLNEIKEELKQRLEDFAQQSKEMAAIVNKCYKEHEQEIDEIIRETVRDIGRCIMSFKQELSKMEESVKIPLNEDGFIKDLQTRLDSCAQNENSLDLCLLNIEEVVFEEFYSANKEVLRHEQEAKNILDDILDKVMECATNGVMKASEKLSKKVVDIGKCINKEIKDKNDNDLYPSADILIEEPVINVERYLRMSN